MAGPESAVKSRPGRTARPGTGARTSGLPPLPRPGRGRRQGHHVPVHRPDQAAHGDVRGRLDQRAGRRGGGEQLGHQPVQRRGVPLVELGVPVRFQPAAQPQRGGLRPVLQEVDEDVDQVVQGPPGRLRPGRQRRTGPLGRRLQHLPLGGEDPGETGVVELGLGARVVRDGGHVDAGGRRDVAQPDGVEPPLGEEPGGHGEHQLAGRSGLVPPGPARAASRHGHAGHSAPTIQHPLD